jgi:uncharacterized protein
VSYSLDVNVLLYASDSASPYHQPAGAFLESCVKSHDILCLTWPTVMGYLRIATHPSVFKRPLSPAEAMNNIETLLTLPRVRVLTEEEGFWSVYSEITSDMPTRGNLVPDAHLAAILRQSGVRTLYTRDRDFLRFRFLDVRDPFA